MAERIYLGAIIGHDKKQYLPVMDRFLTQFYSVGAGVTNACKFGVDSKYLLYRVTNVLYIKNSDGSIYRQTTAPSTIMSYTIGSDKQDYGLTWSPDHKLIYCILQDSNSSYHIGIYNVENNSWVKKAITYSDVVNGDSARVLYLHATATELIVVTTSNAAIRYSLSTYQRLNYISSLGGTLVDGSSATCLDGKYLYYFYSESGTNKVYCKKYDITNFSLVATSSDFGVTGQVIRQVCFFNNKIYCLYGHASLPGVFVTLDSMTLQVINKINTSSTYLTAFDISDTGRLYIATMFNQSYSLKEYDLNTLMQTWTYNISNGNSSGRLLVFDGVESVVLSTYVYNSLYNILGYDRIKI